MTKKRHFVGSIPGTRKKEGKMSEGIYRQRKGALQTIEGARLQTGS